MNNKAMSFYFKCNCVKTEVIILSNKFSFYGRYS